MTGVQTCALPIYVPLSEWPSGVKTAFLLALLTGEGREASKAFTLARHLRIQRESLDMDIPKNPPPLQRRCSERIRADLPKLVTLGAGTFLTS